MLKKSDANDESDAYTLIMWKTLDRECRSLLGILDSTISRNLISWLIIFGPD